MLTTVTPTLSINPVTDPDGDPVQYLFKVTTDPTAEGGSVVATSGWQAGTTYQVPPGALANGGVYYWHAWAKDPFVMTAPVAVRQFKVALRLGASTPSPMDSIGPASVNLASGNVVVNTASPTFGTVGGGIGGSYSYNSQEPARTGLDATYYPNTTLNGTGVSVLKRVDANINFNWGLTSLVPDGPVDGASARWTGWVKVPITVTWSLCTHSDDGDRV